KPECCYFVIGQPVSRLAQYGLQQLVQVVYFIQHTSFRIAYQFVAAVGSIAYVLITQSLPELFQALLSLCKQCRYLLLGSILAVIQQFGNTAHAGKSRIACAGTCRQQSPFQHYNVVVGVEVFQFYSRSQTHYARTDDDMIVISKTLLFPVAKHAAN